MKFRSTLAVTVLLATSASVLADDMTMASHAGPADKAFMESMQKMQQDMAMKPTGNTDRDFVRMMMPHHQGAIDMAKVELRYGKDPVLRRMAAGIVKAQKAEIGTMKAWRAKHGR